MGPERRESRGQELPRRQPLKSQKELKMHEFTCGHQECSSQFTSHDKNNLMQQVASHLKDAHNVQTATQTLLGYLEATCVKSTSDR